MNAPNLLTVARFLLTPVVVYFICKGNFAVAMWLFLAAGITDALDGFLARKLGQVTKLGIIIDPLADKLLIITTIIFLAWKSLVPWWVAAAIVLRDVCILVGAGIRYMKKGNLDIGPSWPSKANTFLQIALIYIVLGKETGLIPYYPLVPLFIYLTFGTTVYSGIHYAFVVANRSKELNRGI